MKNVIFTLIAGFVILVPYGCVTPKGANAIVDTPQQKTQILKPKEYTVWKQKIIPSLAIGYPINFLNSKEILLEGEVFSNKKLRMEDGKVKRMYTVHPVSKNVPENTLGELEYPLVKDRYGQITEMNIIYSYNDATYKFNFHVKPNESFVLNGNATVILSDGTEYSIRASSIGGECILLIDISDDPTVEPEIGTAEGHKASGTLEIEVK